MLGDHTREQEPIGQSQIDLRQSCRGPTERSAQQDRGGDEGGKYVQGK